MPPRSNARKAGGTNSPAGAKIIEPWSLSGGLSVAPPTHDGAQFTCETLMLRFQRADIDLTAPMTSNLDGNVSGRSKPIETEPLARLDSTQTQCAVADDPGTEERCRFFITEDRWNRIGKCCRDERILRVSAIDLIAGKPGALAQVLAPARAKFADAARVLQPGDPDSLADRPLTHAGADLTDDPDGLVAGNERKRGVGQLAFDDVKIRPADPADGDANQDLPRAWLWHWKLAKL